MLLLPVVLLALSAPPLADPGYRSILGDPGMRARESTTALSGWNFCDGVAQPPAFPLSATPRLADCWVDGANRVTQAANDLAFPGSPIPGQPATRDIELYYRQKEVYLAGLCAHPATGRGADARSFEYSGFEIEFKSGIFNSLERLCPCSGLPNSCLAWNSTHRPTRTGDGAREMNQPLVAHEWSDGSGAGFFSGTWDVKPDWTAAQRQSVQQALTAHTQAWVTYREAELAPSNPPPPRPETPPSLANSSFAFAAWSHRNGSRVYYNALRTSTTYPGLMNYLRVNDASGGYGGYPWDRGFGIMDGPAPNSARLKATLRVIESGHGTPPHHPLCRGATCPPSRPAVVLSPQPVLPARDCGLLEAGRIALRRRALDGLAQG